MSTDITASSLTDKIIEAILSVVGHIPSSTEAQSADPDGRAQRTVGNASIKAATVSAVLSIPPGPLGMLTIVPDLIAIWKIQAQMVADIAAEYGKSAKLTRESMIYCLFKHAAAQAVRDLAVRVGGRLLIKRPALRVIQQTLAKVTVKITQRAAGKAISRWLPIISTIGVGAYAYYDTAQVGQTAMDLFSSEFDVEAESTVTATSALNS
jgi:hypothetical protein